MCYNPSLPVVGQKKRGKKGKKGRDRAKNPDATRDKNFWEKYDYKICLHENLNIRFNGFKLGSLEQFVRDNDIKSVKNEFEIRVVGIEESVVVAG